MECTKIGKSQYQYDAPNTDRIRLFQLDLNAEHEPLSGKILSYDTPVVLDSKRAFLKAARKALRSDNEYIIEELGGGDGYDAVSWCWGQEGAGEALHLSTISNKMGKGSTVQMDNKSGKRGYIHIRAALVELLKEMRRRNLKRFLWMWQYISCQCRWLIKNSDAICINQNNDMDKQAQLPNLRRIYSEAEAVLIWFGVGDEMTSQTIEALPSVVEALEQCAESGTELWKSSTWTDFRLPAEDDRFWTSVCALFMNPWWSRLWTLQEAVVTSDDSDVEKADREDVRRMLCGRSSISWWCFEDFAVAARKCRMQDWIITGQWLALADDKHGFDAIDEVRTCKISLSDCSWGVRFGASLLSTMRRKVTYEKDIIFGQTALMDQSMIKFFQAQSDASVDSLFLQFGQLYIRQELHECLLNHIATKEKLSGLPSWCPNFASERETMPLGSRWLGNFVLADIELEPEQQFYRAGFSLSPGPYQLIHHDHSLPIRPYFKVMTNRLSRKVMQSNWYNTKHKWDIEVVPGEPFIRLSGIEMDHVTRVIDCNPAADCSDFLSLKNVQKTAEWLQKCFELVLTTSNENSLDHQTDHALELLSRTITANRTVIRPRNGTDVVFDVKNSIDFSRRQESFQKILQTTLETLQPMSREDMDESTLDYLTVLRSITRRRRFFVTAGGRVGIGPSDTSVGDSLCVVFFCPTPYLLRPTARHRQLIGEVYVHGLMYGEALQMHEKGELSETQWEIE